MSQSLPGEELIFLIAGPRSGSTLLQRVLAGHPDIHTVSEPWLMLRPLFLISPHWREAAVYDAPVARKAAKGFVEALPHAEEDYLEGVRRMCAHLYRQALQGSGKRFFLDKSPRYYYILPELLRTFPGARYLFLLRNPLATLCSRLTMSVKEDWFRLHVYRDDLLLAPRLLLQGMELPGMAAPVVHYEALVSRPEEEVAGLCEGLGIDYQPSMVEYGKQDLPQWSYGDRKLVYRHDRPVSQNAGKWVEMLADPQVWRLAAEYLEALGQDTVARLGYSYPELRELLDAHRPGRARGALTVSLSWLLARPPGERDLVDRGVLTAVRVPYRHTPASLGRRLLNRLTRLAKRLSPARTSGRQGSAR